MELDDLVESLKQLGEKPAAITLLEALGRHSSTFTQYDALARCFFKIKAYKHALPYAENAVLESKTNEEKYAARTNLVNVYAHAYEPEKALDLIDVLEKINPNDSDTRLKKAYALFLMGRRDEAEKILREELINPETTEKVKKGARLQAYSFTTSGMELKRNSTTKETTKAKETIQIKCLFTIGSNSLSTPGRKTVYMQVITPEGKTMQTRNTNVVQTEAGSTPFSEKRDIDYENESIDVGIYYDLRGEKATKGTYKVKIFCEGNLIGSDSFTLK